MTKINGNNLNFCVFRFYIYKHDQHFRKGNDYVRIYTLSITAAVFIEKTY